MRPENQAQHFVDFARRDGSISPTRNVGQRNGSANNVLDCMAKIEFYKILDEAIKGHNR